MKKKNVLASLLLAGAMFLTACGGSASSTSAAGGVSGSFTGTAKGMGDVSVTLTLTDNVITDCTAKGDEETPGIGSVVIEQFPGEVVEGNTINLDSISGATITSNAFVEAAKAALTEAGLNPDDYMAKADKTANGETVSYDADVVVIGAGNSGMDTCRGAYEMGAESVIAVDVQKPAAFQKEIAYFEGLGGKIVWPFFTSKITPEGVYGNDGRFIEADQVIVSIGEAPVLDFLPEDEGIEYFRKSWLVPKQDLSIMDGVFTAGDTIKPGRLTDAIGSGRKAAWYVDQYVMGKEYKAFPEKKQVPADRLSKAYFEKCHHCELGDPVSDYKRCVSCGTCRDCKMCLESCPEKAINRIEHEDGTIEYTSDPNRCIGCGICAGVCPCGVWTIQDNPEKIPMYSTGAKA